MQGREAMLLYWLIRFFSLASFFIRKFMKFQSTVSIALYIFRLLRMISQFVSVQNYRRCFQLVRNPKISHFHILSHVRCDRCTVYTVLMETLVKWFPILIYHIAIGGFVKQKKPTKRGKRPELIGWENGEEEWRKVEIELTERTGKKWSKTDASIRSAYGLILLCVLFLTNWPWVCLIHFMHAHTDFGWANAPYTYKRMHILRWLPN